MQEIKFFPRNITIETTEKDAEKFIKENVDDFLDFMFKSNSFAVSEYIDEKESEFSDFILSGGAVE